PHRPEKATVLVGHRDSELIEISLPELRLLVKSVSAMIYSKGFKKGDTIMMASFYSSNELANAVLFLAFACMGIRVFIPMYPEPELFTEWHRLTGFKCIILPCREILRQQGLEREKEVVAIFQKRCKQYQLPLLDAFDDFNIPDLIQQVKEKNSGVLPDSVMPNDITTHTEAVIFTTSGTSGKSKLVVYSQGAFSISCQSWAKAGLFDPAICGNPALTPLFAHTIGIRTFINSIWSGNPFCVLTVDWFLHKPEIARYLLLRMKPGHIIGGPALFNMLLEFFRHFPELKTELRKNLRALISIGAPFQRSTARQIRNALGLDLWNAFGTTETQMVLLNRPENGLDYDPEDLGTPLPGVSIKLGETPD
ncbi:MAG TPA: AMP-binding protein, partial [Saprospiraceae bacterium]|nr:AMP-binding protein [Saprospiraceae bacterium]